MAQDGVRARREPAMLGIRYGGQPQLDNALLIPFLCQTFNEFTDVVLRESASPILGMSTRHQTTPATTHRFSRRQGLLKMERVPPFNPQQLEAIAKILADTSTGLTGSQIAYLLQDARISDVSPQMTKWKRLFNALVERQNEQQLGNHVLMFVNRAMNPVNYTGSLEVFTSRQSQLNSVLAVPLQRK